MKTSQGMSVVTAAAALALGVCAVLLYASEETDETQPPPQSDKLAERVAELEARLARLEELEERVAKLEALQKRVAELELTPRYLQPTPAVPPGQDAVPPNWHPREFNGLRYYIVPLNKDAAGTHPDAPRLNDPAVITD